MTIYSTDLIYQTSSFLFIMWLFNQSSPVNLFFNILNNSLWTRFSWMNYLICNRKKLKSDLYHKRNNMLLYIQFAVQSYTHSNSNDCSWQMIKKKIYTFFSCSLKYHADVCHCQYYVFWSQIFILIKGFIHCERRKYYVHT